MTLPPFGEFDWKEKLEDIFLIDKGGVCLYHKMLVGKSELINENLVSGAISSINMFINGLTDDRGISVFHQKNKTIVIYPGTYVSGVIIVKEDLNFIKILLKEFVQKFEIVYNKIIKSWNGNISVFNPVDDMCNSIFKF